jgi:hypothetical protein
MTSDLLVSMLSSVVASGVLAPLAAWLASTWAAKRIESDVSHTYAVRLEKHRAELKAVSDQELEVLRAQLTEVRAIHAAATSAVSAAQSAVTERRLRAVETLWSKLVRLKRDVRSSLVFLDVLTPEELESALLKPNANLAQAIEELTWQRATEIFLNPDEPDPELSRLFVNEPLWAYFDGYHTFLHRVLIAFIHGRKAGQLRHWLKDSLARQLFEALLTPEERANVLRAPVGHFASATVIVEQKFLRLASDVVSGRLSANAMVEETNRLRMAVEAAREPSNVA